MERLPPKSALTQKEKGGGENEKRGTESCSIESFPPNGALAQKEKRRAEEKTRVEKKAPPEPPSRALVTHPPPKFYPKTDEQSNSFTPLPPFSLESRDQPPKGTNILLAILSETRQGEEAIKNENFEATKIIVPVSQRTAVISRTHSKAHFQILEDNPVGVGQETTDEGQYNTFPIVDNDPGCEQEDDSKTSFSGGTQYNTFAILEDNPQEYGSKTSFLGGTQGPATPKNNCNISYLDRWEEQEIDKPDMISVLDQKQELLESPVQDSLGNNCNLAPVLGKEKSCKTVCLESAQGDIRHPDIISVLDHKQELWESPVQESPGSNRLEKNRDCKTLYLGAQSDPEGKEKERCKLTVPPDIISVSDHKQELWESPVQENPVYLPFWEKIGTVKLCI